MDIEKISREIFGVIKKDGRIMPFDVEKIVNASYLASLSVAERDADEKSVKLTESEHDELRRKALEVGLKAANNLYSKKQLGTFPNSKQNIPHVEDIHQTVIETLDDLGFHREARTYYNYHQQRLIDEQTLKVSKQTAGQNPTDKSLFVISESKEVEMDFNRKMIALSLMKEANLPDFKAYSVAKETERRIKLLSDMRFSRKNTSPTNVIKIKTSRIREIANEVMEDLGISGRLRNTDVLTIPVYDYEQLLLGKNKENSNVVSNSPEMLSATVAEWNSREYMLNCVFSKRVSEAHLNGQIHLHDLGMGSRVYCSSHSPATIAKWGLKLENLSTNSSPAKHTHTLTGHLNTFLASMQAYYAGALGVAYINDLYAPFLASDINKLRKDKIKFLSNVEKEMTDNIKKIASSDVSLEVIKTMDDFLKNMKKTFIDIKEKDVISNEDIDKFLKQEAQYLIFSGSQMAFSRGGQTLFLDFNIHTGTPNHIRDNPAIGPGGKYHLRKNNELIPLKEVIRTESNRQLSTLFFNERKVMNEKFIKKGAKSELVREYFLESDEKIDTIGDYEDISKRFARALLRVWDEGDSNGGIFPFPKCDLHITEETFTDPSQKEILDYACKIASRNGSPYFIFDREATTLSACCRLRTTIEDDYFLKKLESLRFCGMQNVTINSPQAAFRAGKNNREKFIEIMKEGIELAIEAHLIKKELIKRLGIVGGVQYQTQKHWFDGRPYVDLSEVTCIIGLLGFNDAYQYLLDKEFHEDPEVVAAALEDLSILYAYKEKRSKETGLLLKFEETPGESTCRRFAKIDLRKFPEQARSIVKGSIEKDEPYYTNSIHFRADAKISLTERIRIQSMFHQLIEAGAIIHVFVGEERPPAESIMNLIKWSWKKTMCAQITISPEFTYCKSCNTITPGYNFKKDSDKINVKGGIYDNGSNS